MPGRAWVRHITGAISAQVLTEFLHIWNLMQHVQLVQGSPHSLLETGPLPSANCFVECQKSGTRQIIALGKGLLCRVPDSRQKRGTRHRLPHVTVFGHVLLCRVSTVRHSAKIFFLENTLSSAPDTALGKDFFFQNVFAECPCEGTRQRRFFF